MKNNFEILTPVVTIFDDNENIHYEDNKKIIEYLIEGGVNGIVPLGSTGEFTHMSLEEKKNFLKFYVKEVNGRVSLLPGTGCTSFNETVELSNFVLSLGVNGVLVIGHYYYSLDQNKIFEYYNSLAKKLNGDIYIYNFEARTGHNISSNTVYKLCSQNENIKGIKDSTGVVTHTLNIISKVVKDFPYFKVYSGFDDHFIPNIMAGGRGCIAALSNLVPELWHAWVNAANNEDFSKISDISKIINSIMPLYIIDSNFSLLFKTIMKARGLDISTKTITPFEATYATTLIKGINLIKDNYNNF